MTNTTETGGQAPLPFPETTGKDTDDIPVLTDILSSLPELADVSQNEAAWDALEESLSRRIRRRIDDRMQVILQDSIRKTLEESLSRVTGHLVEEIKKDLESTLDVIVSLAVQDELRKLKQK